MYTMISDISYHIQHNIQIKCIQLCIQRMYVNFREIQINNFQILQDFSVAAAIHPFIHQNWN